MLLTGIILWGVCAIFGIIRRLMCAGVWLSLGCDILMGMIWAAIFCLSVTIVAEGRIRLYHPVLITLGAAVLKAVLCLSFFECTFIARFLQCIFKNHIVGTLFK